MGACDGHASRCTGPTTAATNTRGTREKARYRHVHSRMRLLSNHSWTRLLSKMGGGSQGWDIFGKQSHSAVDLSVTTRVRPVHSLDGMARSTLCQPSRCFSLLHLHFLCIVLIFSFLYLTLFIAYQIFAFRREGRLPVHSENLRLPRILAMIRKKNLCSLCSTRSCQSSLGSVIRAVCCPYGIHLGRPPAQASQNKTPLYTWGLHAFSLFRQ